MISPLPKIKGILESRSKNVTYSQVSRESQRDSEDTIRIGGEASMDRSSIDKVKGMELIE